MREGKREPVISDHAGSEILRRQISEEMVRSVVERPQQIAASDRGRQIRQTKYYDSSEQREMLLRVVCETRGSQIFVVTAYRTSKISKYWVEEA